MTAEPTRAPSNGVRSVDGLEVNEVDDGLVIYEGLRDRVHYLNHTAGVVFALCTGEHGETELPTLVREVFGSDQPTDAEVTECLVKLRAEGLIV